MQKLISISLSPNVFSQDIESAKEMLCNVSLWGKGSYIKKLESEFQKYFITKDDEYFFYTFNSGRSALLTILKAFGIGKEDEVLLQAFTCNAVPNPVLWVGAKPVYVDVDENTFNVDANDLQKKVTRRCKAVIVQHTFGLAVDMETIMEIAKKHHLFIIEDCAHALGSTYKEKKVGTFGAAAFFSFGRDKVISSVYGGAAIISSKLKVQSEKLKNIYETLTYPSEKWIKQQLRHPITMDNLLRWYNVPFRNYGIGKLLLQLSQASRFLSKAVHWKEKRGLKPDYFPARLPNALAYLALKQFKRLDEFNTHRQTLARFYYNELKSLEIRNWRLEIPRRGHIYLRYPVRHPNAHQIISQARKKGILLGDWYDSVVAPSDTNLDAMGYKKGSCPVAETLARQTFNLPTNPNLSLDDAKRVVAFLKSKVF